MDKVALLKMLKATGQTNNELLQHFTRPLLALRMQGLVEVAMLNQINTLTFVRLLRNPEQGVIQVLIVASILCNFNSDSLYHGAAWLVWVLIDEPCVLFAIHNMDQLVEKWGFILLLLAL